MSPSISWLMITALDLLYGEVTKMCWLAWELGKWGKIRTLSELNWSRMKTSPPPCPTWVTLYSNKKSTALWGITFHAKIRHGITCRIIDYNLEGLESASLVQIMLISVQIEGIDIWQPFCDLYEIIAVVLVSSQNNYSAKSESMKSTLMLSFNVLR